MKNETRKEQKKDTKKLEVKTRAVEEFRLNKFISHNSNYSRREELLLLPLLLSAGCIFSL